MHQKNVRGPIESLTDNCSIRPAHAGVGTAVSQRLLLCDFLSGRFTSVKLRGKQKGCASCSSDATILESNLAEYSYPAFTEQAFDDRCATFFEVLSCLLIGADASTCALCCN